MAKRVRYFGPQSGGPAVESLGRLDQRVEQIQNMDTFKRLPSFQQRKDAIDKYASRLEADRLTDKLAEFTAGFSKAIIVSSAATFPDRLLIFSKHELSWRRNPSNPERLRLRINNRFGRDKQIAQGDFETGVSADFLPYTEYINFVIISIERCELTIDYDERKLPQLTSESLVTKNPERDGLSMDRAFTIEPIVEAIIKVHQQVWWSYVYQFFHHPQKWIPGVEDADFAKYIIDKHPASRYFHYCMVRRVQSEIINYSKFVLESWKKGLGYDYTNCNEVNSSYGNKKILISILSILLESKIGWKLFKKEPNDKCLSLTIPKFGGDSAPCIFYTPLNLPQFSKRCIKSLKLFRRDFGAVTYLRIIWNMVEVSKDSNCKKILDWIYVHPAIEEQYQQTFPDVEAEKAQEQREESEDSGAFDEDSPPIEDTNIGVEYTKRNLKEEYKED